jgi:hypothetical protein
MCPACLFAKQTKRQWRHKGSGSHSLRNSAKGSPGSLAFADQMISSTPGLIPQSTGHLTKRRFRAATIFVDSFSDYTHVSLQEDLTMDSTLDAKLDFERKALTFGVQVKGYHADNGRFAEAAWKDSCHALHQTIQFCGVGSHHQNGVVERRIRDLSDSARASLLHAIHHWPDGVSKNLWPFALKHACNIRNRVRTSHGKTPEELMTGSPSSFTTDLSQYHPFGCPAYVLDARLQGGSKIPRWEPRSRVGVYLGHSPYHANNVALILNLSTGHVSPQYHVVYDDNFTTVDSIRIGTAPSNWPDLYNTSRELVTDDTFELSPDWTECNPEQSTIHWLESRLDSEPTTVQNVFHDDLLPLQPADNSSVLQSEGAPPPLPNEGDFSIPQNEGGSEGDFLDPFSGNIQDFSESLEPSVRRSERTRKPTKRLIEDSLFGCPALKQSRFQRFNFRMKALRMMSFVALQLRHNEFMNQLDDGTVNYMDACAFHATIADNDTYFYHQAMQQPDRSSFIRAMVKEVNDLFENDVWQLRRRSELGAVQTIKTVWSFKRKRSPDGTITKHKARLCAHGGMQVEGVHFWDTYSPVVQMTTVRILLTLSLLLRLQSRSIDFTLAFTQAPIDVPTYLDLPMGFSVDGDSSEFVLELKKTLYGLRQAGLNWFDTLREHLLSTGFHQSALDPCCYMKGDLILLCYVDDCLLFCPDGDKITNVIQELKQKFTLEDQGDVAAYLGIDVARSSVEEQPQFKLSQPHLTQRVINSIGLSDSRLHDTPAEPGKPLTKDFDGLERAYNWSFRSVIGMLNYLCGTRPDILYSVHQCSRFCNNPKLSHEKAIKRIIRYLKRTPHEGIILQPDSSKGIQCYVDADFANGWNASDCEEPSSVYSRTGYVIMFAGCPIVWVSKLQTEVALSTTEAEYIALSQAMRDLIPLLGLLDELSPVLHLNKDQPSVYWKACGFEPNSQNVFANLYEDNTGAYELAKAPKMRPRTKHIALKYHHFREHVNNGTIKINLIGTKDQIADIFTKALDKPSFTHLRKLLCGW